MHQTIGAFCSVFGQGFCFMPSGNYAKILLGGGGTEGERASAMQIWSRSSSVCTWTSSQAPPLPVIATCEGITPLLPHTAGYKKIKVLSSVLSNFLVLFPLARGSPFPGGTFWLYPRFLMGSLTDSCCGNPSGILLLLQIPAFPSCRSVAANARKPGACNPGQWSRVTCARLPKV